MKPEVETVARTIRERFDEPLTLEELAASVYVSPFHFLRVFRNDTGLTPGKFLTAVRFFEAKKRLVETDQAVADVVCGVGYSSVGTFTSTFVSEVGMTPTQYRDPELRRCLLSVSHDFARMPDPEAVAHDETLPTGAGSHGALSVSVSGRETAQLGVMYTGLFPSAVPQGAPVTASVVEDGESVMETVPVGDWHAITVGTATCPITSERTMVVGRSEVHVEAGEEVTAAVDLEPVGVTDAPFLVAMRGSEDAFTAPAAASTRLAAVA